MKTLSASYIKNQRDKMGLTQEQLAKRLKVKRYNLAKYETGLTMPPGDVIIRLQNLTH
jgi:transcriptional regulator with XRE-family HTH domain